MPDLGEVRPELGAKHRLLALRDLEKTGITNNRTTGFPDFIGKWELDMGSFGNNEAFFGMLAYSFGQMKKDGGSGSANYGWLLSLDDTAGSYDIAIANLSTFNSTYSFGTGNDPEEQLFDPDNSGIFLGYCAWGDDDIIMSTRKLYGYAEIIIPAVDGFLTRVI